MQSPKGISSNDYAANFADFLDSRPEGKPFSFWYGATEPHRSFSQGIGRENGMDPELVEVPPFLPDVPEVRNDILDYCFEVQWFDQHLLRMLQLLEEKGELENTLVVVTSDNGMAFPRAKANVYEYGIHMPLAVSWPARIPGDRTVDDLVNLIDVTATIYDATGIEPSESTPLAGASLMKLLSSDRSGIVEPSRQAVYSGRERHSSSRYNSLSYPQRCIRTQRFLYIHNFRPERWPAGTPQKYDRATYGADGVLKEARLGPEHGGYHDIDGCPTLSLLIARRDDPEISPYLAWSVDRRPAEELYDIQTDPGCLQNLAEVAEYQSVKQELADQLFDYLRETGDARVVAADGGDIWETYPRYSSLRWFPVPDWAKGNPDRVPNQDWVEERRPR
jgi:uncharacterized sulfatase